MNMQDLSNTRYFKVEKETQVGVKEVLQTVYEALEEKGYNPVNHNARSIIMKVERDELVEELLREYIAREAWK